MPRAQAAPSNWRGKWRGKRNHHTYTRHVAGGKNKLLLVSHWDLGICDDLGVDITTSENTSETSLGDISVEVFSKEADTWLNRGKKELPSPDMNRGCSAGWGPGMPEPFTCLGHQNSLFIAFRIPKLHQDHLNFSGVKKLGLSPVVSLAPCHTMGLLTLCNCMNQLLWYLISNKSVCPMGFVSLENYISRLLLQNNLTYSECYTPFQMKANSI